jgi:hypothetical protein
MDPISHIFLHGQNAAVGVLNVGLGLFYALVITAIVLGIERIRSLRRQRQLDRDKARIAAFMRVQARKEANRFASL